jgi:hypothetical protein
VFVYRKNPSYNIAALVIFVGAIVKTNAFHLKRLHTLPTIIRFLWALRFRPDTKQLIVEYYLHWTTTFEISFSVVQTQTTTAYCGIQPTLQRWDIFSDHLSDTIDQLCVISIMKTHVKLKMFVPYKWLCFKPKYLIAHNKDFSLVLFVLKDLFFLQRTHSMLSNLNFFL